MWLMYASDENYARPLAVSLYSTLRHLDQDSQVRVLIVSDGIGAASRQRLLRVVEHARPGTDVTWFDAGNLPMQGLLGSKHISATSYVRLFVGRILPEDASRVLYLDCDLLVRSDVTALFRVDLQERTLAAVRDVIVANPSHPSAKVPDYAAYGLSASSPYFNAGVLVIDLERWRHKDAEETTLRLARTFGSHGYWDQDALNVAFHDDWLQLDPRWNVQAGLVMLHHEPDHPWRDEMRRQRPGLLSDPSIVHFSGSFKPWLAAGTVHPFARHWRRELNACRWYKPTAGVAWRARSEARRTARLAAEALGMRQAVQDVNG